MAPLCWFGNPYRFRQAMSFSWFKPNARQNQLSRRPLRCFQWLMKSTIWSRTEADTHCTFNFSPQFFLTRYVQSTTWLWLHLFEIILILGYQLSVDDCDPVEECLWKKRETNCKRPVSAIHNIDLDVFPGSSHTWDTGTPSWTWDRTALVFLTSENLRRGRLDIRHLFQLV